MTSLPIDVDNLRNRIDAGLEVFDRDNSIEDLRSYLRGVVQPELSSAIDNFILNRHQLEDDIEYIVHYTNVNNLFRIMEKGELLLFDSDGTNDPDEGSYFIRHVEIPNIFGWNSQIEESNAYIASFITDSSTLDPHDSSTYSPNNDLKYWQAYGQDGKGCSIAMSIKGLEARDRPRKVLYGAQEVDETSRSLSPVFQLLSPITDIDDTIARSLTEIIWQTLNSLRYLYKDSAYDHETECRYVLPRGSVNFDDIHFCHSQNLYNTAKIRHCCTHPELSTQKRFDSAATITLGPAIGDVSSLKRAVEIGLQKYKHYGPKIIVSEIPYRAN